MNYKNSIKAIMDAKAKLTPEQLKDYDTIKSNIVAQLKASSIDHETLLVLIGDILNDYVQQMMQDTLNDFQGEMQ